MLVPAANSQLSIVPPYLARAWAAETAGLLGCHVLGFECSELLSACRSIVLLLDQTHGPVFRHGNEREKG